MMMMMTMMMIFFRMIMMMKSLKDAEMWVPFNCAAEAVLSPALE